MGWYRHRSKFPSYVSVAERKQQASEIVKKLKKKGQNVQPIIIEGRNITKTFWGKAWCKHLGSYSDYENRLPRGRSYVRNGAVIDLKVTRGEIIALVSGSSVYTVKIVIAKVVTPKWNKIVHECAGKIDSLIELLQGKFSKAVMRIVTDPEKGLFPHPNEIKLSCSCPDWAEMCKHVAAVLYGIGARFDDNPEELFLLRQVDHLELIAKVGSTSLGQTTDQKEKILADGDLSSLFGIDIGTISKKETKPKKTNIQKNKVKPRPKKRLKKSPLGSSRRRSAPSQ